MKLYSTGKITDKTASDISSYDLSPDSDLTKDIRNAKSIQIVSAFYNHDFFAMVCSLAKKSAQIEIIIPRERGMQRQKSQRAFCNNLGTLHKHLSVLLVDSPYLLHTKLYLFDSPDGTSVWFGSSNASTNSLEMCEELMARCSSKTVQVKLLAYYKSVRESARRYDNFSSQPITKGLQDFFSQGSLYVKTSEAFNPAIELDFGEHRDAVMAMLSLRSDDIAGLFINATTRLPLFGLLQRIPDFKDLLTEVETNKTHAEGIKKFGIATCLGLWVPDGYKHEVDRILYKSLTAVIRKEKLDMIHNLLSVSKRDEFSEIVAALKTILEGIAFRIDLPRDTFYQSSGKKVHPNINRLIRKLEYCLERLSPESNYRLRNLLINPYFSTSMPSIWDDELVKDDFLVSICDSLNAESERKRIENYVYHSLAMFGETDKKDSTMSSKPEQLLRPFLVNDKDRWFSQYDLKLFKKLNGNNTDFNLLPLAKATARMKQKGMVVFIDDGDYLVRGEIAAITEKGKLVCNFDDDTVAIYSNNTLKLLAFC